MILDIDIGNTRIKWRLCEGLHKVSGGSEVYAKDQVQLAQDFQSYPVDDIRVASVLNDVANQSFAQWAIRTFAVAPRFAKSTASVNGVMNGYSIPERLGVDRWLAIVAAYQQQKSACVVVDCGSAVTVDLVDSQGKHKGGYIAPGLTMIQRSLALNTHAVNVASAPACDLAPGRDTAAAVNAAQSAMLIGLVMQAIEQLQSIDHRVSTPALVLTGGDADWLAPPFPDAFIVPDLVFDGLDLVLA